MVPTNGKCCHPMPPMPKPNMHPNGCCACDPGMVTAGNMHLFLEENCNSKNSFIKNVNILAINVQALDTLASHICEIMNVSCCIESICAIANHLDYVNYIAKNIDTIIELIEQNSGKAFTFSTVVDIASDQPTNYVVTFADENAQYLPASGMLQVGYNGTECYIDDQYEEVGTIGVLSNKVKMLFPLRAGDQLSFKVYANS